MGSRDLCLFLSLHGTHISQRQFCCLGKSHWSIRGPILVRRRTTRHENTPPKRWPVGCQTTARPFSITKPCLQPAPLPQGKLCLDFCACWPARFGISAAVRKCSVPALCSLVSSSPTPSKGKEMVKLGRRQQFHQFNAANAPQRKSFWKASVTHTVFKPVSKIGHLIYSRICFLP